MLSNALDGITVIDFTHIGAGPTSTMLLADMGAKVIKIEPTEGELGRKLGPSWIGNDSASWMFAMNQCSAAMLGRTSPDNARSSFITAMKAAGMQINCEISLP